MRTAPRLLAVLVAATTCLAACGGGPATGPTQPPVSAGPVAAASTPLLTPVPGGPALPVPGASAPGAGLEPTEAEAVLLAGARLDLAGLCGPVRDDLPELAVGRIGCVPANGDALYVVMDLFDNRTDLLEAYLAQVEELGIELRSEGTCEADAPSEGAYTPGDDRGELLAERGACWTDAAGAPSYLAALPPFVLARVSGPPTGLPDRTQRYAWLGNEDVPGAPTLWREIPVDAEK